MGYDHVRNAKKTKRAFHRTFLTKAQAARKLSVDAKTFRRLCILKGVYPRHVKSVPEVCKKGGIRTNSTFYFSKDITFIAEDPILRKLFRYQTYQKKITKFLGRGDIAKGKHYKDFAKPQYSLVHCVKERYPSFADALREIDDALCHVFLYAQLPSQFATNSTIEGHNFLTTGLSEKSKRLAQRWNDYVANAKALRKAFISVKGFYFQADIYGQTVTWLMPHYYTTRMPVEVDYHVMMTFLEFYVVMLDFVLFRLEHELSARTAASKKKPEDDDEDVEKLDPKAEDFPLSPEEQANKKQMELCTTVFQGFKFFVGSEVPNQPFSLICRALSGTVTNNCSEADITHEVMDRPAVKDPVPNRDYVQPQWLVDCLNCKHVLPVDQYYPGKLLPPHLSPFEEGTVTDHQGRPYEPERLKELQRIMDPTYHAVAARIGEENSEEEGDAEADNSDAEVESLPEVKLPNDGIVTDDEDEDEDEEIPKKTGVPAPRRDAELKPKPEVKQKAMQLALERKQKQEMMEKRMRAAMMSKNKRKLWEKIQFSRKRKDAAVQSLADKRKLISEGKLKVAPSGFLIDTVKQKAEAAAKREARRQGKQRAKKAPRGG